MCQASPLGFVERIIKNPKILITVRRLIRKFYQLSTVSYINIFGTHVHILKAQLKLFNSCQFEIYFKLQQIRVKFHIPTVLLGMSKCTKCK